MRAQLNANSVLNKELIEDASLSFGRMIQETIGEAAWMRLDPAIAARFAAHFAPVRPLRFNGTMQWVYCSPWGMLIARLLHGFRLLPAVCARHCPFQFDIGARGGSLLKQRRYGLSNRQTFIFCSRFNNKPQLHEEFTGGLGMYIKLFEIGGALWFLDGGYFLRIANYRLPLPRWLTVGRFELVHRSIDQRRFQVIIRVSHPWFGTLFYQRGEFQHA